MSGDTYITDERNSATLTVHGLAAWKPAGFEASELGGEEKNEEK